MEINYNDNPLATTITLNESDKRVLWLQLKVAQLEGILESAWFDLKRGTPKTSVVKILDIDYWCPEDDSKSKLEQRVDELYEMCIGELTDAHIGDCTCMACSCSKCYAEELLGINTIEGLRKHWASMIQTAFENLTTIDEAIHWLDNYVPDRSRGGWDTESDERWASVSPTFCKHAEEASAWLKEYKTKFLLKS